MTETEPFDRKILPVRELTGRVRRLLEQQIGRVWVLGECSNVREPASGHCYFTLKDEQAQIAAVWFKGRRTAESVKLKDGMSVRVYGMVSAYERGGGVQIVVEDVEDAGLGDLQKAFDALKKKLAAEGLFDASRKQPLPLLPARIGIVTSPTGAVIRDIIQVLTRRYPDRHLTLAPVKAQGEGSANGIANAIQYFNQAGTVDVIIIGRGGGSLEDLWSFNEEIVARAIAASALPVISAVGHETDFTISDFVADVRAPTPSAAAELVIGRKEDFELSVRRVEQRMKQALLFKLDRQKSRLARSAESYVFKEPGHLLTRHKQRLQLLSQRMRQQLSRHSEEPKRRLAATPLRMQHAMQARVAELTRRLDDAGSEMLRGLQHRVDTETHRLKRSQSDLKLLNPYSVLERGFSITRTSEGRVVQQPDDVTAGTDLETLTGSGRIYSTVTRTEPENKNE